MSSKIADLPRVIGITGPIGAGKSTIANYLVEKYGYTLATNSDVLLELLLSVNVSPTRENLQKLGNRMFEILGNDIIAKSRVSNLGGKNIVIDGIRYIDELEFYRKNIDFRLIGVTVDSKIRYKRIDKFNVKDKGITFKDFENLEKVRSELEVPFLLEHSDKVFVNDKDTESLSNKIDCYLSVTS